jgi:hypothetical protein
MRVLAAYAELGPSNRADGDSIPSGTSRACDVTRRGSGIREEAYRQMARIEGEIVIAAPIEQVFDTVADERNEPRYNPRIIRARKTSQGPVGRGTRFTAEPRGAGHRGIMTVQIVDYDRPRRLATSVRSSYMDVDGVLIFAPAGAGGTLMRWSWDMRLRGAMRVLSPLIRVIGPRWEYRNWAGLKQFAESDRGGAAGVARA